MPCEIISVTILCVTGGKDVHRSGCHLAGEPYRFEIVAFLMLDAESGKTRHRHGGRTFFCVAMCEVRKSGCTKGFSNKKIT
ncbi:MAG: hypothetical protein MSG64_05180 [Pyrinomonadaceae bacterium MAG19_C2-C3]|nr:hypothetical protein [Pyrinomonadaceae bacterium MAG19_C2-C3]